MTVDTMRLGKTELILARTGFGALPIQRTPMPEAGRILLAAFDAGITFFDTARGYTDSEDKMGRALSGVRDKIIIATKTGATTRDGVLRDLETSLKALQTDHVDLLQLHNPSALPDPSDREGPAGALLEAKAQGLIRHIGFSSHKMDLAASGVKSGFFETLQYPLSAISDEKDLTLIELCRAHDVGCIAMKPLCGGLLTDIPLAFAFFREHPTVIPIWGIQRMSELEEIVGFSNHPPILDEAMRKRIEKDRAELSSNFCRGCAYCLPCPADIPIPLAARMRYLLRRAPIESFLTEQWLEKMGRIRQCQRCGACHERCPYGLDPAEILPGMLEDFEDLYAQKNR